MNPYPVYELEESLGQIVFQFETSSQITYRIRFQLAGHLFDELCIPCFGIFEVSFAPETSQKQIHDERISMTIALVIFKFIEQTKSPVLFICDSLDRRHECRHRLFSDWFTKYNKACGDNYLYAPRTFEFTDFTLNAGLIGDKSDRFFFQYFDFIDKALLSDSK